MHQSRTQKPALRAPATLNQAHASKTPIYANYQYPPLATDTKVNSCFNIY